MSGDVFRVFADASDIVGGGVAGAGGASTSVESIVMTIIRVVLWLIGILAVAMVIYGGVKFVMSQGDPGKTATARHTIIYAVIGVIVAIFAYVIVGFVEDGIKGSDKTQKAESSEDSGAAEV